MEAFVNVSPSLGCQLVVPRRMSALNSEYISMKKCANLQLIFSIKGIIERILEITW